LIQTGPQTDALPVAAAIRRNGSAIAVNGTNCGTATVSNTNSVTVTGAAGRQHLTIDLSGGPFAPSFSNASGELAFAVDLGAGTDRLIINGSGASDTLTLGSSGVNLNNDTDRDVTVSGVEESQLIGLPGDDTLSAAGGLGTGSASALPVLISGDDGNDTLTGGAASTGQYPYNNNDLAGGAGADTLTGGPGGNGLTGGLGADTLSGGAGDDFVYGDDGLDTLNGGPGYDLMDGGVGSDTMNGGDAGDNMYGSAGPDHMSGGNGNDGLVGGPGNDGLSGGAGNDTFTAEVGPDGADDVSGGSGRDSAGYNTRSVNLTITLDGLANDGQTGEGDNVRGDVEGVTGGTGDDTITGNAAPNSLWGNGGDDIVDGRDGADLLGGEAEFFLYGIAGDDTLIGGDGEDTMAGDDGADSFQAQDGGVDFVNGGPGTDTMTSQDAFDAIFDVP
jgi:Ca2+-binding RTX toxin-like protein